MESRKRTILKTVSWRIVATFITGTLGWLFTGDASFGLGIGLADTMIKFFVYYFHERAWTRVQSGYVPRSTPPSTNGGGI